MAHPTPTVRHYTFGHQTRTIVAEAPWAGRVLYVVGDDGPTIAPQETSTADWNESVAAPTIPSGQFVRPGPAPRVGDTVYMGDRAESVLRTDGEGRVHTAYRTYSPEEWAFFVRWSTPAPTPHAYTMHNTTRTIVAQHNGEVLYARTGTTDGRLVEHVTCTWGAWDKAVRTGDAPYPCETFVPSKDPPSAGDAMRTSPEGAPHRVTGVDTDNVLTDTGGVLSSYPRIAWDFYRTRPGVVYTQAALPIAPAVFTYTDSEGHTRTIIAQHAGAVLYEVTNPRGHTDGQKYTCTKAAWDDAARRNGGFPTTYDFFHSPKDPPLVGDCMQMSGDARSYTVTCVADDTVYVKTAAFDGLFKRVVWDFYRTRPDVVYTRAAPPVPAPVVGALYVVNDGYKRVVKINLTNFDAARCIKGHDVVSGKPMHWTPEEWHACFVGDLSDGR